MGRQLLADEPAFAAAIAELEPVFVDQTGFSLQQVLVNGEAVSGDARVQPVLMGLQLALTELWLSYGVIPDAVIGHSMGEVTAAVVTGALSVAEGLRVIAIRSRLMSRLAGEGAVALLKLDAEATAALIANYPEVNVAGISSPRQTVIAGPPPQVDAVIAAATEQGRFARRVNMEVASHNALMDPILPELRSALADLAPKSPAIPFFSTVCDAARPVPVLDAVYWVANVRLPVQLSQAISVAAQDHTTFIEISPHPILTQAITETLGDAHHHSIGTLWREADDAVSFHTNFNTTHSTHPPHTPHPPGPHPTLPTTRWHHTRHWLNPTPARRLGEPLRVRGAAGGEHGGVIPAEWYCELRWPVRELPAAQTTPEGSWLVVGDAGLGVEIGHALGAHPRVTVVAPTLLAEDADRAALVDALDGVSHVVYAPDVPLARWAAEPGYELFNTARRLSAAMTAMASPPRLFLLTCNAQPLTDGDRANPAHAVLWGLGRTLALEHPEIWGGLIDVDESVPAHLAARYVLGQAHGGDGEDQVVYRVGARHVPRLQRHTPPQRSGTALDNHSSQLVIGATGNIGPQLIEQLAEMGAGTIVAVSRNPGSRLDEVARTLSEKATTLVTVAANVSDEAAMAAVFDRFGADLPPLGGIYLAAYGGGPVTLRDMSHQDVTAMFAPKLDAVSLLHRLSLKHPVRQFVLFSSISGILGSRWLSHYAATTTFLDTFAYARRAAGLPGTAINWGLWKSLADNQNEQYSQVTLESGLEPMPDEIAIEALWSVTTPGAPARSTLVAADWTQLATAYRTRAPLHIIDDLLPTDATDATDAAGDDHCDTSAISKTEFREALRECEPTRRHALLTEQVTTQVAAAMGLASPQLLDPAAGFFQSGMDSLMSVTLQRALTATLGQVLPASVVFDYPSVEALTDYLATILPELVEVAEERTVGAFDDLTDDELLQQLSERVG
jgi:phthiocerol/phenolphthiocerol synthesis type-I polyketide synthase B